MYPQTLYSKTKQVLKKLAQEEFLSNFYLAGGTALALQLGHRKSIDLDFFTDKFPKREILLANLSKFNPKVIQEAPGTLDTVIDEVKVSFLEYKYPLLEELVDFENVKVVSVADIACMKLSAVSSRGSKKDFIDLYFILQEYSLSELFEAFEKKFAGVNYQKLHLLKSISYFRDANDDPNPDMAKELDWQKVKKDLEEKVKNYLTAL